MHRWDVLDFLMEFGGDVIFGTLLEMENVDEKCMKVIALQSFVPMRMLVPQRNRIERPVRATARSACLAGIDVRNALLMVMYVLYYYI